MLIIHGKAHWSVVPHHLVATAGWVGNLVEYLMWLAGLSVVTYLVFSHLIPALFSLRCPECRQPLVAADSKVLKQPGVNRDNRAIWEKGIRQVLYRCGSCGYEHWREEKYDYDAGRVHGTPDDVMKPQELDSEMFAARWEMGQNPEGEGPSKGKSSDTAEGEDKKN